MGCMNEYEDDRGVCPHCGYIVNTAVSEPYHLAPGTVLDNKYIVGKVLGSGKNSVTYIGFDNSSARKVVIKEYMPTERANRVPGSSEVVPYDGERGKQYEDGLRAFLEEYNVVAAISGSLEGVVKVYDGLIENNTAYIIMEYVVGVTLDALINKAGRLDCNEVIQIMLPALRSLDTIHSQGCVYCDISPENIIMTRERTIKLLGLGARSSSDEKRSMSVKNGFAAEELYRKNGEIGPWTDVYALAATVYYAITGLIPVSSNERKTKERLKSPSDLGVKIDKNQEIALMNALNIYTDERTQSVKEFVDELTGQKKAERIAPKKRKEDTGKWSKKMKALIISSICVAATLIIFIVLNSTGVINFSSGDDIMPNCIGKTEEEASEILKDAGLKYKIVGQVESEEEAGIILYQNVQSGSKLSDDIKIIKVKISSGTKDDDGLGENEIYMPNLLGLTEAQVDAKFDELGIEMYNSFEYIETDDYEAGLACKQSVESGKVIDVTEENNITIYFAKAESKSQVTTHKVVTQKATYTEPAKEIITQKKTTTTKKVITTKKPKTTKAEITKAKTTKAAPPEEKEKIAPPVQ